MLISRRRSNLCITTGPDAVQDDQSDVHVLNRQATRSPRLAGLLREIYTIAVENNISLYARHRPGVDNVLADFLSRPGHFGS